MVVLALLAGCSSSTDLVARRRGLGVVDGGRPDAPVEAGPEAGLDAAPDAAPDAEPPAPPLCAAIGCERLASRALICASEPRRPSVQLGDGCEVGEGPRFRYAVCACSDLVTDDPFGVDVLAGVVPGSASVAINQDLRLGADATIDGSLRISGLYSPLNGSPPQVSGSVLEGAAPACDCEPARLLDVAALVQARASDNDNDRAGLDPASLDDYSGMRALTLDCGRYYLPRLAGSGPLQIEARGRVALFIDGNIELGDTLTLTLQDAASAEIFVRGNVRVNGRVELSTSNDGNRILLMVGGTGNIQLNGPTTIDGSLYAPRAELVTQAGLELHGAMFVRRAALSGVTRVHFEPLAAPDPSCMP